ncbi:MAG TPA: hypothetical protein VFW21_01690 [Mycobacterium sp.]|nr:hypothetical protein [Mycobacterium sp.]
MTPVARYRRRVTITAAVLVMATGTIVAAVALNKARDAFEQDAARPLAVGDCVVVAPDSPTAVRAQRSGCGADPSYTVGALVNAGGTCPTTEYQHFPAPVADGEVTGLCLVPNLVAEHCYRLDMPIGLVERAGCDSARTGGPSTGLLVQVTRRLDVHDQSACPSAGGGKFAWPYPSPARTYCTSTLF